MALDTGIEPLKHLLRKLAPVMPVVGFTLETAILAPLGLAYLLFVFISYLLLARGRAFASAGQVWHRGE